MKRRTIPTPVPEQQPQDNDKPQLRRRSDSSHVVENDKHGFNLNIAPHSCFNCYYCNRKIGGEGSACYDCLTLSKKHNKFRPATELQKMELRRTKQL